MILTGQGLIHDIKGAGGLIHDIKGAGGILVFYMILTGQGVF